VTRWVNVEEWGEYWYRFHIVHENSDTFETLFEELSLEQMSEGLRFLGL
jgi:hypothetical protein